MSSVIVWDGMKLIGLAILGGIAIVSVLALVIFYAVECLKQKRKK